jgi:hypothetical protein
MRSTIDFFQSSFSELFAARPSRIAATSTGWAGAAGADGRAAGAGVAAGAAAGAALPGVEATAGVADVGAGALAAGAVAAGVVAVGAVATGAWLNIFDIRLLSKPII